MVKNAKVGSTFVDFLHDMFIKFIPQRIYICHEIAISLRSMVRFITGEMDPRHYKLTSAIQNPKGWGKLYPVQENRHFLI